MAQVSRRGKDLLQVPSTTRAAKYVGSPWARRFVAGRRKRGRRPHAL